MATTQILTQGLLCLAVLAWVTSAAFAQAESQPDAATILDRLEQRTGVAAARAKVTAVAAKGKMGGEGMPAGTFEEVIVGADRARLGTSFPGLVASSMGTQGNVSYGTDPAMGVSIKEGPAGAALHRFFAILRRAPWKTIYAKADLVGTTRIADRPHFELRMTPTEGKPATWFVDAESYTLSRLDIVFPDPMGGELPMQWLFSDWKPVGGILYPHTRVQKAGIYQISYTVDSIEQNPTDADARVAPPPEVVKAIADPARRSKQAPEKGGECAIEDAASQHVASIRLTIKPSEVSKTLAVILPEVVMYLGKLGVTPIGPPFSRYHSISDGSMEIEAGLPIAKPIAGEGRVKSSELPGGKVATTWHIGRYGDLPKTYALLEAWMKAQSHTAGGPFWEIYWTDPGIERDPAKWRTQIFWPVK